MKRSNVVFASAVLGLAVGMALPSLAAETSAQQRCLNKVPGTARKVTSSVIKTAVDCLKKGWNDQLPPGLTAQACLTADLKGSVAKADTKVTGAASKFCQGPGVPDFGFVDAATTNAAYGTEALGLVPDFFESDLDSTIAGALANDDGAHCSSGAFGQATKVADAMTRAYLDCVKTGLKNGNIVGTAGLDLCLDAITADPRGKITKAIARVQAKLASSSCPPAPGDFFPAVDGAGELCDRYGVTLPLDATGLATCMAKRIKCRICRTVNDSQNLSRNCDQFDDGSVDATCPACPNGMVDEGEQCDDGNAINGDGCTSDCKIEFCGDGVINNSGTEQCDDGAANSDTTPNACRTNCTLPVCGDGIVDNNYGEECDEGGVDSATCDSDCTFPVCGDGHLNTAAGEACDDGNNNNSDACVGSCQNASCGDGYVETGVEECDGGECCDPLLCTFSLAGTPCTGASSICVTPQCNGLGSCGQSPVPDGLPCDDGSDCTTASSCQSGVCTGTAYTGVGQACEFLAVGSKDNDTGLLSFDTMHSVGGDWCGLYGDFDVNSVFSDSIIATKVTGALPAIIFGLGDTVDGGDIVTNNSAVGTPAPTTDLPGLGVATLAAGQHLVKTPSPTFYDTTGNDPRVAQCIAAQNSIDTTKAKLDSLPTTANLGATYKDLNTAFVTATTMSAVNVGGLNVFDMTYLNGTGSNVTIPMDGGGNANTVFVLRISQRMNTGANWIFQLQNGLTANHVLFYVSKNGGDEACALGLFNTGGGTLFCPDVKIHVNSSTQWQGAAYGGASGLHGELRIGDTTTFTYVPFTAPLP